MSIEIIKEKYTDYLEKFNVFENNKNISISLIIVRPEFRKQGIGRQVIQDINNYADLVQKIIVLTPDNTFGTSKKDLITFYKSLGFIVNKGRNKDYSISELMYRLPKMKENHMYTKNRFKKLAGLLAEDCTLHHDKLDVTHDDEGAMAKGQLEQIVSQAGILLAKIPEEAQMESWVQSKITTACELIDAVFHYLVDEIPEEQFGIEEGKEFDDSFEEYEKKEEEKENLLDLDEPFKNESSMDDEIGRWYDMKDKEKRKAAEKLENAMKSGNKTEIQKAKEEYEKAAYVGD